MRHEGGALLHAVELMVALPLGQRPFCHVKVQHRARTGQPRHHRESAGVGKQVQHAAARVGLRPVLDPLAASGHVQKQAVVLAAQQVHLVACAVFTHEVRRGHAAGHQAVLNAELIPMLKHPIQRLAWRQLGPAGGQRLADLG